VYVVERGGSVARARHVRIGFIEGGRVAVTGGLDGISEVIVDGAPFLRDGTSVRTARTSPIADGAAKAGGAE
jgi:hypothetical protein